MKNAYVDLLNYAIAKKNLTHDEFRQSFSNGYGGTHSLEYLFDVVLSCRSVPIKRLNAIATLLEIDFHTLYLTYKTTYLRKVEANLSAAYKSFLTQQRDK